MSLQSITIFALSVSITVNAHFNTFIMYSHPSTQTACLYTNPDGTPTTYGDQYGVFKYCFPKDMNTNYIRSIAEAVSAYNKESNIRWYYDCTPDQSTHFISGTNEMAHTGNFGQTMYIKAMNEMGRAVGLCEERERPDQPGDITTQPIQNPTTGLSASDILQINDIYAIKAADRYANPYRNKMPRGQYALPMTRHGCPDGFRDSMFNFADENVENINSKSADYFDYMVGYQDDDTLLYFCDSGNSGAGAAGWPRGQYCILRGADTTSCPSGFQSGYRYMSDGEAGNANQAFGEVDVIENSGGSAFHFCCIDDGDVNEEAVMFSSVKDDMAHLNGNGAIGLGMKTIGNGEFGRAREMDEGSSLNEMGMEASLHDQRKEMDQYHQLGMGPDSFALYPLTSRCQKFKYYSSKMLSIRHGGSIEHQQSGHLPYGLYERIPKFYVCVYGRDGAIFSESVDMMNHINLDTPDNMAAAVAADTNFGGDLGSSFGIGGFRGNPADDFDSGSVGGLDDQRRKFGIGGGMGFGTADDNFGSGSGTDFDFNYGRSDVIAVDNPNNVPPANDEPGYDFRLYLNYKEAVISLVVVVVMSVMVLISAFICCRYAVNKCMKREKRRKYAKVSLESDAWSASDADKDVMAADCL